MSEGERERRRRLEALFAAYSPDILAYCGWRADSVSDAQDAVAEVFLTAWRRLDALPEGDAARVWLYATARRVIANQRRSRGRQVALYQRLALDAAAGVQPLPSPPGRRRWYTRRLAGSGYVIARCCCWRNGRASHPRRSRRSLGALRRFRTLFEDLLARDDGEQPRREASDGATTSGSLVQPRP
jgi:hypothetical protein